MAVEKEGFGAFKNNNMLFFVIIVKNIVYII